MRNRIKNERGFTLVEVLAVIGISSGIILSQLLLQSHHLNSLKTYKTKVNFNLLNKKIVSLLQSESSLLSTIQGSKNVSAFDCVLNGTDCAAVTDEPIVVYLTNNDEFFSSFNSGLTHRATICEVDSSPECNIRLRISWEPICDASPCTNPWLMRFKGVYSSTNPSSNLNLRLSNFNVNIISKIPPSLINPAPPGPGDKCDVPESIIAHTLDIPGVLNTSIDDIIATGGENIFAAVNDNVWPRNHGFQIFDVSNSASPLGLGQAVTHTNNIIANAFNKKHSLVKIGDNLVISPMRGSLKKYNVTNLLAPTYVAQTSVGVCEAGCVTENQRETYSLTPDGEYFYAQGDRGTFIMHIDHFFGTVDLDINQIPYTPDNLIPLTPYSGFTGSLSAFGSTSTFLQTGPPYNTEIRLYNDWFGLGRLSALIFTDLSTNVLGTTNPQMIINHHEDAFWLKQNLNDPTHDVFGHQVRFTNPASPGTSNVEVIDLLYNRKITVNIDTANPSPHNTPTFLGGWGNIGELGTTAAWDGAGLTHRLYASKLPVGDMYTGAPFSFADQGAGQKYGVIFEKENNQHGLHNASTIGFDTIMEDEFPYWGFTGTSEPIHMHVFNVNNKLHPFRINQFQVDANLSQRKPKHSAVYDNNDHIVLVAEGAADTIFYFINITDPLNPVVENTFTISGVVALDVAVKGNTMAVSFSNGPDQKNVKFYDLTNPSAPVFKKEITLGSEVDATSVHMNMNTTITYVGQSNGHISIYDCQ